MDQIIPAIAKAMGAVKKIGKDDRNAHDGYNFASIDAFLELVNPICAEHGLLVHMEEEGIEDFTRKGKFGDNAWMRVRFALTVYHASGQSLPTVHRSVEVLRNGAQAYGSAQSYALKQFLRALLLIATGDADDADHRATDTGTVKAEPRRSAPQSEPEPPHDPQTGEVYSERNPPPTGATEADSEDADAPSVKDFMDQVRERLAMEGNKAPSRDDLEHAYAMAVIENMAKRKSSARAKQWYDIFCDLHGPAIGRIQSQSLRMQVRSAIAFKGEQIAGKNPDPADFGFPFGHPDPIVLGDVQVTDDAGRPV